MCHCIYSLLYGWIGSINDFEEKKRKENDSRTDDGDNNNNNIIKKKERNIKNYHKQPIELVWSMLHASLTWTMISNKINN